MQTSRNIDTYVHDGYYAYTSEENSKRADKQIVVAGIASMERRGRGTDDNSSVAFGEQCAFSCHPFGNLVIYSKLDGFLRSSRQTLAKRAVSLSKECRITLTTT